MSSSMEVSSYNSRARRVRGGIWNEHVLPVMEWEAAEHRVVLPRDLQDALGIDTSVLRWASKKYLSVTEKHERDLHVVRDLSCYLNDWAYFGEESDPRLGNARILFQDEINRWYAVSIGPDVSGSVDVITVSGSARKKFLQNRLGTLRNVVRKEK